MQDPLLRPWYDEALTNALTTINAEYEDTNNTTDTDTFSLPDDFFENSAYIDPMVPNRIKGLKSTELKEYGVNHFMQFVKELSNRGLIDRDTESLNKFIRAFTGRTPTTNMKNTQFSKADWKGEFGDLLYTIKYFTYQEKDKYAAVLSLFNFREDVHQKIVQALQRNPASYAKAKIVNEQVEVLIESGLGECVKSDGVVGRERAFLSYLDGGVAWCSMV